MNFRTFEENKNDESSDDDIPLSHYSPLKGKKGNSKQSKKLPVCDEMDYTFSEFQSHCSLCCYNLRIMFYCV